MYASLSPMLEQQYPIEFIKTKGIIKLQESATELVVGCVEVRKTDQLLLQALHQKPVRFEKIARQKLSNLILKEASRTPDYPGNAAESAAATAYGSPAVGTDIGNVRRDAPTVNLVNSIIQDAVFSRASDVHMEVQDRSVRVRYRIDGVLVDKDVLPSGRFAALTGRIKIMADLDINERRRPQDGSISVTIDNGIVDIRVSCVPTTTGESIVLRLLNHEIQPKALNDLGLPDGVALQLRQHLKRGCGLVVVSGPTGCGKTTTLHAMLREPYFEKCKVISIEDPVEYSVHGVDQIQTNEAIGLGFDSLLRRVLRQDPDVIMVGEIRDRSTAELALRAALTGHLVLTSVHTADAASVVTRLRNLQIPPYLIAAVLRAVLAQRLVRRAGSAGGRIAVAELLTISANAADSIRRGCTENELRAIATREGQATMVDRVQRLLTAGTVAAEDATAVIEEWQS